VCVCVCACVTIRPCLNPTIFNPEKLDTELWMEASVALGMKEICLTAKVCVPARPL
jgi:hypothetical protein